MPPASQTQRQIRTIIKSSNGRPVLRSYDEVYIKPIQRRKPKPVAPEWGKGAKAKARAAKKRTALRPITPDTIRETATLVTAVLPHMPMSQDELVALVKGMHDLVREV